MNKKLAKTLSLGIIAIAMGSLAGCSATHKKDDGQQDAQNYVDQQMLKVSQSVDGKLQDLLASTRGNEGARSETKPLGSTVAGKPTGLLTRPALTVSAVAPGGNTQMSRDLIAQKLDQKVKITWNKGASELLSSIAKGIDFTYYTVGTGSDPKVRINAQNETVKSVLGQVANQVNGQADVQVDIKTKTIKLVYR